MIVSSDVVGPGDRDRVVALHRVVHEDRLAGLRGATGDPLADRARERLDALLRVGIDVASPGDRDEPLAVDDVDAAGVVVDEHPQLVHDRLADRAHVVQPVQLAGEALEHLQVGDRADVAARRPPARDARLPAPRRGLPGSCRAPSRSSSRSRRRRPAHAGSWRARAPGRCRSRRSAGPPGRTRCRRGRRRSAARARARRRRRTRP